MPSTNVDCIYKGISLLSFVIQDINTEGKIVFVNQLSEISSGKAIFQ